jgi:hypothetical protein
MSRPKRCCGSSDRFLDELSDDWHGPLVWPGQSHFPLCAPRAQNEQQSQRDGCMREMRHAAAVEDDLERAGRS